MEILSEVFNIAKDYSWVLIILTIAYSGVHWWYEQITKSDLEKSLTYRGNDRVITGVFLFIFLAILVIISSFKQIIETETNAIAILSIILALFLVTLVFFVIVIIPIAAFHNLFIWKKIYPEFEVKLYEEKMSTGK